MTKYYKVFSGPTFRDWHSAPGTLINTRESIYSCDSPNWTAHWHACFASVRMYPTTDVVFTEVEPIGNIKTMNNEDGRETVSDALRIIRIIPKSQFAQLQIMEIIQGKYNEKIAWFNYLQHINMEFAAAKLNQPRIEINNIESITNNSFRNTRINGDLSFAQSKITKITTGMFSNIQINGNLILPDNAVIMPGTMRYAKIRGLILSATEAQHIR